MEFATTTDNNNNNNNNNDDMMTMSERHVFLKASTYPQTQKKTARSCDPHLVGCSVVTSQAS